MQFIAEITIMPLRDLLDPQGKAISLSLKNLHLSQIEEVRMGKHIHLRLQADSAEQAHEIVENACKQLLVNPIMEQYSFSLKAETA
ncbi:MAG: phosphoribosylformylglycinamidine synthase subunit PurS [Chitinophagales bacterium]|nr:phosphoribosylformylglycinamidine synthase subunit PurS [Bacteroidota bacterium]MCB9042222.1 phosphoribosylformylglycinamidine synthase subunit PurS [Chitinophagales bacterium]